MKKWLSFFLHSFFLFFSLSAFAQFRLASLSGSDMRLALEKVITDFPKDFTNLKGEVVTTNPQSVEYTTLLSFKAAENNRIIQHSGKEPVYSWQALMFTAEEFETAEKKYKALYKELKSTTLTLNRDYTYGLEGTYNAPNESLGFASSVFRLVPNAAILPKVKVELSMDYEMPEWKIFLKVYQREREDSERGEIKE